MSRSLCLAVCLILGCASLLPAQPVTRAESLAIAESFINHSWKPTAANLRHGKDAQGVLVHAPDQAGGECSPIQECWQVGIENKGVPYKWGGFNTPESFDAGIKAGKAAGDVYSSEKRRLGGQAVSADAVGIDCSGFISRCWKLSSKHSTSMLFGISEKLASPSELRPGDVMNTGEGHVLLFVRWMDAGKTRALFYEAAPFSKTLASEHMVAEMAAAGFVPLRYKKMAD